MKMMSTKVCAPSWADVVKGKADVAAPAVKEFQFSTDAADFAMPEFKFDSSAVEFAPPNPSLNASAKEFDPSLLQRAAKVQSLLLSCYSDDDDDSTEDEAPRTMQKCTQGVVRRLSLSVRSKKTVVPAVAAVRPPPGLEGLADTPWLNPFAKVFDPVAARAAEVQNLLLACYSDDDDSSDDEFLPSKVAPLQDTSAGETSDSDTESVGSL